MARKKEPDILFFVELAKAALHALILSYYHPTALRDRSIPQAREIAEDAIELAKETFQKIKLTQTFDKG